MTPQIIYISLIIINLVYIGNRHGKQRKGSYNMWLDLLGLSMTIGLLYWGGFFDPVL